MTMRVSIPRRGLAALQLALIVTLGGVAWARPAAGQTVLYAQPHAGAGQVMKSAWYPPDGLDGDEYVYDGFVLGSSQAIQAIQWRGGYTNFLSGAGESPVADFTISIYASIGAGTQPDIVAPPLVQYAVGGNAGEQLAGTFGGVPLYDYAFTLPAAFMAAAGTRYWIQIEASQGLAPGSNWPPDWGLAVGSGGDGSHFRAITGGTGGGGTLYQTVSNDAAFTLLGGSGTSFVVTAAVSPPGSGSVTGAGPYPAGANAQLTATPATGYGFDRWTENGATIGTSPTLGWTVHADRTVVANFLPAFTVSTSPSPRYGGVTAGGGTYLSGSTATVTATPATGFTFAGWTEFGVTVSGANPYGFSAGADRALVAEFATVTPSGRFDFDTTIPPVGQGQSLPFVQSAGGLTAIFDSPQGAVFSAQSDGSTGWHMAWFSGLYLYDNDLNRNALDIHFDRPLSGIDLTFATADFNQAELPTLLQLTAYQGTVGTSPVGSTTARGAYIGSTMPMGTLSFHPAAIFDVVELVLPYQPLGCTDFFLDDILASVAPGVGVEGAPPRRLALSATPNPARQGTMLAFELAATGPVRLEVFDLAGRHVRTLLDGRAAAGPHAIAWDMRDAGGTPVPPGAYVVSLEASGRRLSRRVVALR